MCRPYLVSCSFSICEREVVLGVRLAPQGTLTARLAFLLCTLVVFVTSVDFLSSCNVLKITLLSHQGN